MGGARKTDYTPIAHEAALRVMAELSELFREYRDHIVVIGGLACRRVLEQHAPHVPHVGTVDVDLALDPDGIPESAYESLLSMMLRLGYEQRLDRLGDPIPFSFRRTIRVDGETRAVQVDLMAPAPPARKHRHHRIQDVLARAAPGVGMAFRENDTYELEALLPNGARVNIRPRVANAVALLVMKGTAVGVGREKDAYDLYLLVKNYKGGPNGLYRELEQYVGDPELEEALRNLRHVFDEPDGIGPTAVADFEAIVDPEERERLKRDVYEVITYLLDLLAARGAGQSRHQG